MTDWRVHLLDKSFNTDSFDCGVPQLNDYLQKYAKQNQKKNIAKTYVATSGDESKEVLGYYSASTGEIAIESLPESFQKGLPRYPIPVVRIGKLAVSLSMQGQGLGRELLIHALYTAFKLSQEIGIFAVVVDAIDDRAKYFYIKNGFIAFQNKAMSLFIPMNKIAEAFT